MERSLLYDEESFAIRGAVYEVYKQLGCGFLEGVYQEALELELKARATGMKLGFLVNFSHYPGAEIKRIAL